MISLALLIPNIVLITLFAIDGLLIYKYYKRFYEGPKLPSEWKILILSLILFPLLSKISVLILRTNPSTNLVVFLYVIPLLTAMVLSCSTLILWKKHKL